MLRLLRGSESNVELELSEDVPLHRVVQLPPHLQLLFIKRLPILCLGEELIDAWLQLLQHLIREKRLFTTGPLGALQQHKRITCSHIPIFVCRSHIR